EFGEVFRDDSETEKFHCGRNQSGDAGPIKFSIRQQARSNLLNLLDRPPEAAAFGKSKTVDRAIAAHTRNAAEQCIARDLSGNEARIQLQDNFVARHFSQVIRIGEFFRADAQLVRAKSDFGKKPRASPAIVIENGNRFLSAL